MYKLLYLSFIIIPLFLYNNKTKAINNTQDTIYIEKLIPPQFLFQSPEKGLKEALDYFDIHHSDIVFKQAILETGKFKSKGCIYNNNLFGLMNKQGKLASFTHWSESVLAYKNLIQYKYKDNENYYDFLLRINYATDVNYINKLKNIK